MLWVDNGTIKQVSFARENFHGFCISMAALFTKINLDSVPDIETSGDVPCNSCQLLPHVKIISNTNDIICLFPV